MGKGGLGGFLFGALGRSALAHGRGAEGVKIINKEGMAEGVEGGATRYIPEEGMRE